MSKSNHKKRPAEVAQPSLPVFATIAQCAAVCGIPVAVLRHAKRTGCPGFQGSGRLDLARILPWLFAQSEASLDFGEELRKWQAKREKLKHDKDAGDVIDRGEVRSGIREGVALLLSELDRIFLNELPPALKGCDEIAIARRCKSALSELRSGLKKKFAEIGTKTKEENP